MKTLDDLFAALDGTRRLVKRNVTDMVTNPADYGRMVAERVKEKAENFVNNRTTEDTVNVALGGIMAGPKAVSPAVQQSIEAGQRLAVKGYDADFIFKHTGRFISPGDRMARVEISDVEAALKPGARFAASPTPLADLLEHPQLFEAYPQLKNLKVEMQPGTVNSAFYRNAGDGTSFEIGTASGSLEQIKQNLLHEIQHAVQAEEGFARGGTRGLFTKESYGYNPALASQASNKGLSTSEAYKSIAGEAEARAVEARSTLTPELLKLIHPEKSYDVPLDQLLVRF